MRLTGRIVFYKVTLTGSHLIDVHALFFKQFELKFYQKIPDIYNGPTMITKPYAHGYYVPRVTSYRLRGSPKFFFCVMVKILHIAIIFWIIVLIGYLFYQALKILMSK
jgi:hypothetical protein